MTPEQLAEQGLEAVPWERLEDVKLDAWYRWLSGPYPMFRIWSVEQSVDMWTYKPLIHFRTSVHFHDIKVLTIAQLAQIAQHSTDNGKTWHPCHNIRPIGGRIEHEKLAVGGEVINKSVEGL